MLGYCHTCCLNHTRKTLAFLIGSTSTTLKLFPKVAELGIRSRSRFTHISSTTGAKLSEQVVFLGSDSFSVCSLQVLLRLYMPGNITVVVSNEKNTVAKFSTKNQLKIISWEEFKTKTKSEVPLNDTKFDIGIVASFGYLIPKYIIESCRMGILNVHASLLPKWRGAAPITHAIMNGDKETGITIMKIAPHKFDVGPVLHTKKIAISDHMKAPELTNVLAHLGAEALEEVLRDLPSYTTNSRSQSLHEGTLAPRLAPEIGQIRWDSQTPVNIYNLFRGIYGSYKVKSTFEGKQVDFGEVCLASTIPDSEDSDASHFTVQVANFPKTCDEFIEGQILFWNKVLCVKCFNRDKTDKCIRNNWIFIRKVKIGKKWISALDFNNGFLSKSQGNHYFVYLKEINTSSRSSTSAG